MTVKFKLFFQNESFDKLPITQLHIFLHLITMLDNRYKNKVALLCNIIIFSIWTRRHYSLGNCRGVPDPQGPKLPPFHWGWVAAPQKHLPTAPNRLIQPWLALVDQIGVFMIVCSFLWANFTILPWKAAIFFMYVHISILLACHLFKSSQVFTSVQLRFLIWGNWIRNITGVEFVTREMAGLSAKKRSFFFFLHVYD